MLVSRVFIPKSIGKLFREDITDEIEHLSNYNNLIIINIYTIIKNK